ncbi:hypothetical protein ACOZ4I_20405 (plasmid) [Haloarcula salina]|uniref:hypothetical protein n=1 Tax=Haloarcula salina TaxID=1429914 RepID=UPI003C70472A
MGSQDEYERCVDAAFSEFRQYDQISDIVSAWEQFLSDLIGTDDLYFDRFPAHPETTDNPANTPTFTASMAESYGIVFKILQDVPSNFSAFSQQILYLTDLDRDNLVDEGPSPDQYDLCLIIASDQGQQARMHINEFLDQSELDENLVPLEFSYIDQDTNPKYRFERMTLVGDNFRDEGLPERARMSPHLSSSTGELESIEIGATDFDRNKATGILCNEEPPHLYLACHMWDRVFYDQLDDAQKIIWEREDPSKTLEFEIEVDDLTTKLNRDYIPNGSVKSDWVDDTLEYLCVVESAKKITGNRYRIDFRNLREKRREYRDVSVRGGEFSDLAKLFAEWHCENTIEMDRGELSELRTPDEEHEVENAEDWTQPEIGEF